MSARAGKRIAKLRLTLTGRAVAALRPAARPWIAWDDRLTGFGVRIQPSGVKSFIVNYRAGAGGRKAPNRRLTIGRHGRIAASQARRLARDLLGRAARGGDPAGARTAERAMPTLAEAFADYLAANPGRAASTEAHYRREMALLADWFRRPLNAIARRDVEARFHRITARHGRAMANLTLSLLGSVYRRPCVDREGLRNPVELWLAGGGRYHPKRRRKISSPAEVAPRWRAGIEAAVANPVLRDVLWFGLYTGMRRGEVLGLRWQDVDMAGRLFRVAQTKTGAPLELPITRQLAAILARRLAGRASRWVFPSATSASGHVEEVGHLYRRIARAGGAGFWFHALRNCFITVAERDLMLPAALTKRLVNHARPGDVTEGYAADWTLEQLRRPAQRLADRLDALMAAAPIAARPMAAA